MNLIFQFLAKSRNLFFLLCLITAFQSPSLSQARFLKKSRAKEPPRIRMGLYPCSTMGTNFIGPKDLGIHGYKLSLTEQSGIMYTCLGGHIDIAHVRKAADWTAYLAYRTFDRLMKNKTKFTFRQKEPSVYHVRIEYPQNWRKLPQNDRARIAFEISVELGKYFSYSALTWHEILTWFGYKATGLYSEFPSAFSWEDSYSNALGCRIGGEALRDPDNDYDMAMTLALDMELKQLKARSAGTARQASDKVKGLWYTGDFLFFVDIRCRNFDIGIDDGLVTPKLVPALSQCPDAMARSCPAPSLDVLEKYGFSVVFEIQPKEWEKKQILSIVYPDKSERKNRFEPRYAYRPLMEYIKEDAIKKYHYDSESFYPIAKILTQVLGESFLNQGDSTGEANKVNFKQIASYWLAEADFKSLSNIQ